ncbi:hypothetical protein DSO57_1029928 [Entomophthora muscae]|uniref:Uncharacterized protein n=1 Tax=Entomophthora muscae TaxID=34485 RepID=A0ACC2TNV6_9FUNG|nr:hypothetical protein DSO57_1029928 [Entomophthora muscae]
MYDSYMSDNKGQDDNEDPQYYQTAKGKKVLKKIAAFCSQVHMPCIVAEPMELLPNNKKTKYQVILNVTQETFKRLMEETNDYKKAQQLLILMRSAFQGSFKYIIEKEERYILLDNTLDLYRFGCGRDLVGSNLGVGCVRDGFKPLDTWTVI